MDPSRPTDRSHRSFAVTTLRTLLLTPIPFAEFRLIDIVSLAVGGAIAVVVCLPILAATLLVGAGIGLALKAVGAPDTVTAMPGLIAFVGGLAVCFVILLRLYRRFPPRVRSWVIPTETTQVASASALPFRRDPNADDSTLLERVADAARMLGPDDIDLDGP